MSARLRELEERRRSRADHAATTPRNMMIALLCVLLLCMLVQHTRFLARFFASLPEWQRPKSRRGPKLRDNDSLPPVSAIPNSATFLTDRFQLRHLRRVAGGGLFSGWILRKGQPPTGLTSPSLESKEGFDSPHSRPSPSRSASVDSLSHAPLCPTGPQFLPPPHVKPALSHLPFSRWLYVAPFSWLPSPFASTVKVPQLCVIALYLIVNTVALFWKSNPLPPTPKHPYGNDFQRSGLIAMAQIPLVVALGVRGNIIGLCVGKGYERLKTLHKIVGRVCFTASTIHTAFWGEYRIPLQTQNADCRSCQMDLDGQASRVLQEAFRPVRLGRFGCAHPHCRLVASVGSKALVRLV